LDLFPSEKVPSYATVGSGWNARLVEVSEYQSLSAELLLAPTLSQHPAPSVTDIFVPFRLILALPQFFYMQFWFSWKT